MAATWERNVVHVVEDKSRRSGVWMWAVLIAGGIEALALFAGALLLLVALIGGFTDDASMAVFILVFGGGMGLVLTLMLISLRRGKRWARGPLITWQLFQLVVAIPVLQGSTPWIGAALLLLAVTVMVGMFTPRVLAHTTEHSGPTAAL